MVSKAKNKQQVRQSAGEATRASSVAEPYVVLARKYRPKVFGDLIGQDALVVTLKNAFEAGRIAQAYMLTGVRGVGKTTTARILARALNFAKDGARDVPTTELPSEAGEFGRHCAQIMESRHVDVIEMDAASNTGVDNIREIIESARYKPLVARYKIFIIDEVHMLSKGAFNALLKTLEEPPEHVKFIFATTEIRKVPVTVLSRCQRFDLRRVDVDELTRHFKMIVKAEGAKASSDALGLIARAAEGSVRDGLSILDQAIAFQRGDVKPAGVRTMLGLADRGRVFDLLEDILGGRAGDALSGLEALYKDGCEPVRVLSDLAEVVHLATRVKAVGEEAGFEGLAGEDQRRASALSGGLSIGLLARVWQMLLKGIEETARAPVPLAAAEMVVIRMAYSADLPTPDELIKTLGGGTVPKRASASPEAKTEQAARTSTASLPPLSGPKGCDGPGVDGTPSAGPLQLAPSATPLHSTPSATVTSDREADPQRAGPATDGADQSQSGGRHANPKSFDDVLALVGLHRDARLKVYLEEHVSLVKFDAVARAIDLHLLAGAPKTLGNDLREKLVEWTGSRWIVVLSSVKGAPPVAQTRREELAGEVERLKAEPLVKAALEAFPDAKIVDVSPMEEIDSSDDSEAGTA